jgi:hypothetical protein
MANLNVFNIGQTTAQFNITNLQYVWDTVQYQYAFVQLPGPAVYAPAPPGSSKATQNGDITGLTANTTYTADGQVRTASGAYVSVGSFTFTTQAASSLPSAPSLISVSGSSSGFSANWSNGANTTYCKVWLQGYGTFTASAGATSLYTSISLAPGTYYVQIIPVNAQGEGTYSNTLSFVVTVPPPSGLTGLTATGNDGYVHLSWNASSGATSYSISSTNGGGSGSVSGTTADMMGLVNGQTYSFTVTPQNAGGSGGSQTVNGTPQNRPTNFAWTTAKVSGQNINVSASEWAQLGSKVNAFRLHKNLPTFTFTVVSGGSTNISAAIYNEMRTKILDMSPPTALPAAVIGYNVDPINATTIAASHFNGLRDSLNSIP